MFPDGYGNWPEAWHPGWPYSGWDSACADEAIAVCQRVCNPQPCGAVQCSTDLNGDGFVDASDLGMLLGAWSTNPGMCPDFDCNGIVNASDLGIFLGTWGTGGSMFPICSTEVVRAMPWTRLASPERTT